jgi:hypothetical protein
MLLSTKPMSPIYWGNVVGLRSVFAKYPGTTRMIAREQAHNVVQFPRELRPGPLCAQCRIPMVVVRGEPQPKEPLQFRSPTGVLDAD